MFGKDKEKPGRLGSVIIMGDNEDEEASPLDMALKGMWRAIKEDDEDGFKESFKECVKHCSDESEESNEKSSKSSSDSDSDY